MILINSIQLLGATLVLFGAWLIHPGLAIMLAGTYALTGGIIAERQILNGSWRTVAKENGAARQFTNNGNRV